jgi:hypothetical protein
VCVCVCVATHTHTHVCVCVCVCVFVCVCARASEPSSDIFVRRLAPPFYKPIFYGKSLPTLATLLDDSNALSAVLSLMNPFAPASSPRADKPRSSGPAIFRTAPCPTCESLYRVIVQNLAGIHLLLAISISTLEPISRSQLALMVVRRHLSRHRCRLEHVSVFGARSSKCWCLQP